MHTNYIDVKKAKHFSSRFLSDGDVAVFSAQMPLNHSPYLLYNDGYKIDDHIHNIMDVFYWSCILHEGL